MEFTKTISTIFHSHINSSLLVTKVNNNPLLRNVECFDSFVLSSKLSHIWNDIFPLYGWMSWTKGSYIHKTKKIIVEVHNTWNTFCAQDKTQKLQMLRDSKRENYNYEVVFGAIVDKNPRDYYSDGNVRIITGDPFLEFMLGEKAKEIHALLDNLMQQFYKEELVPWLRTLYA